MRWLTENAVLVCAHELGIVSNIATQNFVRIKGRRVLVARDPENKTITGCPNTGPSIKPCTMTLKVTRGYSSLLRINGHRVCLSNVTGLTDGTPPGTVTYKVRSAGQMLVSEI
ncbi:hypothetical protein [Nitrosomonas marina]|uniref:Uncharacterized protein n=1 Tax=Nitrosomonas marina TaxID=917 RepID=A0A1H8GAL4_9PROT|nr:hypothetical protein [Nitrosomonas marina]SEN41042.1 hypothetical protein SAMN05216325_11723 [Nitrosomonas marina]